MGKNLDAIMGLLSGGLLLFANQPATGDLKGRILDPSGAALSGAAVALHVLEGNGRRTSYAATSAKDGTFEVLRLPTGLYRVQVALEGFLNTTVYPLKISALSENRLVLHLPLGDVGGFRVGSTSVLSGIVWTAGGGVRGARLCFATSGGRERSNCVHSSRLGVYAIELPDGIHELTISVDGIVRHRETMQVPPGEDLVKHFTLDAKPGGRRR